jgi:O-antigen/teichoic acid export membrane protein
MGFDYVGIITHVMSLSEGVTSREASLIVFLALMNIAFSIQLNLRNAILNSFEEFTLVRSIQLIRSLLRIILFYIILVDNSKISDIILIDLILTLFNVLVIRYCMKVRLNVVFYFVKYDLKYFKKIFTFSFWAFLYSVTFSFFWNLTLIEIANDIDVEIASAFSISLMLVGIIVSIVTNLTNLLLPSAARDLLNCNKDDLIKSVVDIVKKVTIIYAILIIPFSIFGDLAIEYWLGTYGYKSEVYYFTSIILFAYFITLSQSYYIQVGDIYGLVKYRSIINFFFILSSQFLIYFLSFKNPYSYVYIVTGFWVFSQIVIQIFYRFKLGFSAFNIAKFIVLLSMLLCIIIFILKVFLL